MHPLEKKTLKTVQQENLLSAGERVVIGVSGGPDSMALLHVLANLTPVLDITPAAVYVNHGLRPAETENEKHIVDAAAAKLGIEFFTGSFGVRDYAATHKLSLEHAARILRFAFLEKTANRFGATKIGLAHTADDQAEEVLLRLIRGTARKGLSGMKTMRDGEIIRPFLPCAKRELLDYLDRYEIPFQLDSSNTQDIYLRNRIRNDLLPYLAEQYNPDIRRTLYRTAAILQDEEELLAEMTETVYGRIATEVTATGQQAGAASSPNSAGHPEELILNLDVFSRQPRPIRRRLLEKCCWVMACEPGSRQIESLMALGMTGSIGSCLHLADGLRVTRDRKKLLFCYPQGHKPVRGTLQAGPENELPETIIYGPGSYKFPEIGRILLVEEMTDISPEDCKRFSTSEHLDAGLFSFPLTLRSPGPGDRFHPLGAPGSKKISRFMSDQKITGEARQRVPVIVSDDTVLALAGLRIDHRFRVTEKTTRVVRLGWKIM